MLGIGEAAADILGTIFQKTDRFIVIPQQDIESILAQQRMGATGAVNPDTAAQMGQILGLNAIVTGAVTAYSEAEEGSDYVGRQKQKTDRPRNGGLPYRGYDTGMQIMADSGAGIYAKSASKVLGLGSKAGYDSDLRDGALRDALNKAMVNMMQKLGTRESGTAGSPRWTATISTSMPARNRDLNVGDKLKVFRPGKEIIDPVTKVKLGSTESLIGEAIVQQNDIGDSADLSIAAPNSGTGFKSGDIVKLQVDPCIDTERMMS